MPWWAMLSLTPRKNLLWLHTVSMMYVWHEWCFHIGIEQALPKQHRRILWEYWPNSDTQCQSLSLRQFHEISLLITPITKKQTDWNSGIKATAGEGWYNLCSRSVTPQAVAAQTNGCYSLFPKKQKAIALVLSKRSNPEVQVSYYHQL